MKFTTRKITTTALLVALGVILSIIDSFIPGFVPGMKLGLANIVILMTLYSYGFLDALFVNLLRVFLASFLRGTFLSMGFFMSLSGALVSLIIMFLLKRFIKKLHIVGVSVVGSLFHSFAQIGIAMLYLGTGNVIYYLPILCVTSILTGIFVGLATLYINRLNLIKE